MIQLKLLSLFFLFIVTNLLAHQTGLSFLNIKENAKHKINVVYKKPLSDTKGKDIFIRYPAKCFKTSQQAQTIENGFIINEYELWCSQTGLEKSKIWVEGLVMSDRGVLIRYENPSVTTKSLLKSTTPFIQINHDNTNFELFLEYVNLGIKHIWSGYDHLLFVLSLVLLSTNMRSLLFAISAFTLAHSITLAFGILGIVNIGVAYIEAMIALSILFLARELLTDKHSFTKSHLGVVSFTFGLLHGFGFSTVLKSIGLPQDEIPLSLFSFNMGIEVGQVTFVVVVTLLLRLFAKYIVNAQQSKHTAIAYFIGALSSYWLIDRVLAF